MPYLITGGPYTLAIYGTLDWNTTEWIEASGSQRRNRTRAQIYPLHGALLSSLQCRLWALWPPLALWLHSFSWKLFTVLAVVFLLFFPSPIVDVSPALTCKLSVCHFAASGVHSFLSLYLPRSLPLLLLLLPSAVGWRGGGGGERRVEETVDFACSKYSLYVCGVLSSKERRDRGWFTSFVVVCACVSVCATVCLCN